MIPSLLLACAPDLSGELEGSDGTPPAIQETTSDGVTHLQVDAQSEEVATELDLDDDGTWDVSLRRYVIRVNGGISGTEGVEASWVEGALGETEVPGDGWETDRDDPNPTGDGTGGLAFGDWYDYDESTHELTPWARVWYVRSAFSTTALVIDAYYDDFGTPAVYSLSLAPTNP